MDPVTAMAFTFLPYLLADFKISSALDIPTTYQPCPQNLPGDQITKVNLPINTWLQKVLHKIRILRIIQQRRSTVDHEIEIVVLECIIPCS